MGLLRSFEVRSIAAHRKEYEVVVQAGGSKGSVNLPDVGFGVSQVLPVVVQCFYTSPHTTIMLEQPEIHLHPSVQTALADLFIEAIQSREDGEDRGIQLIVESHSEHFLRASNDASPSRQLNRMKWHCTFVEPARVGQFLNLSKWIFLATSRTGLRISLETKWANWQLEWKRLQSLSRSRMNPRGRKCNVVDTNVLVIANHRDGGSYSCANNCAQILLSIKKNGTIVLDGDDRILSEYRVYCCVAGQPGLGDSFVRWVHDNIGRRDLVQCVNITPHLGPHQFQEFPEHDELAQFDPADEVFVAVSNSHPEHPPIVQAADSKWWGWKEALRERGIGVEFVCEGEIQAVYERKFPQ
jgi:hypothetical protein